MFVRINSAINAGLAKRKHNEEKGFTLIELLVVVLIIGILAAIAIPVFIGQQNSAKDAAVKSDLVNTKTAMIAYSAANAGAYTADTTALKDYGYVSSTGTGVSIDLTDATAGVYCISETSEASGADLYVLKDSTTAPEIGTC